VFHYETARGPATGARGQWAPWKTAGGATTPQRTFFTLTDNPPMPAHPRLLAIETSTDTLSVALGTGQVDDPLWQHTGPGGAVASTTLLPRVKQLLDASGWSLASLDAVVFGRGPGSFTGLRTACAVAQGLAYGAQDAARPRGLPVLPVDTLLALGEEARHTHALAGGTTPDTIVALLDARMNELYVAVYSCAPTGLVPVAPPRLCAPQDLAAHLSGSLPPGRHPLLAGNVFDSYAATLAALPHQRLAALPTAAALLRLAPALLASGAAVHAGDALPLYVRDKVAQTTDERERLRMAVG
jgi:tRNA threonylcarbamoyladenosine biosynthesis protein TsaB